MTGCIYGKFLTYFILLLLEKLGKLTKLTTVYTTWGRGKVSENIEKLYREIGWKSNGINACLSSGFPSIRLN